MNILFICDEYPPGRHGGIGTAVQLLARELVKQGHNVVVAGFYDWGYGGEDEFFDEGVVVYRFRRSLASSWLKKQDSFFVRVVFALLKRTGALSRDVQGSMVMYQLFLEDIIQKHNIQIAEMPDYCDYMRFVNTYVAFPALSVPMIVKLHGSHTYFLKEEGAPVPQHIWHMEHDLLQQADAVVSVSKYTAQKTAEYLDYKQDIAVLYNGINPPTHIYSDEKKQNRVIFTGTLLPKKGIYQLMKAWNIVNENRPDAELWVYGKGPIDKIKALLNDQAQKKVYFKGHVDRAQLFDEISKSAVAVFPSYAECFALAPMEAMACGTAVVYTKVTSGRELIDENENGLLVDPGNEEDIAAKILDLLNNPERCSMLAREGKNKVLAHFNIENIARQHVTFYKEIINKKNQQGNSLH